MPWFATAFFCSTAAAAQASSSPPPATDESGSAAPASPEPAIAPAATTNEDPLRTAGPGRVPLVVESAGGRQSVGITIALRSGTIARDDVCFTPCTLYVPPSVATLVTSGPGIAETETDITVEERGLRVRMRAPSESALTAGRALTVLGVLADIAGVVLLITGVSDATSVLRPAGAPVPLDLVIAGSVTLGVGIGMMVPGLLLISNTHGGVESRGPVARHRGVSPVRFGFAPGPTGVFAVGRLEF